MATDARALRAIRSYARAWERKRSTKVRARHAPITCDAAMLT